MAEKDKELIENIEKQEYKYGFTSDIETETIPRGLNEEVVRLISTKKGEPGVDDRAPPEGLPSLAEYGASHVGASDDPSDRLPGRHLLCGAEALQETRVDGRSRIPNSNARSTSWVFRSRNRWRWRVSPSMP